MGTNRRYIRGKSSGCKIVNKTTVIIIMSIRNPIFIINKSISLLSSLHLPQVVVLDRFQDQVGHGVVAYGLILVLVLHLRVDQDLHLTTTIPKRPLSPHRELQTSSGISTSWVKPFFILSLSPVA